MGDHRSCKSVSLESCSDSPAALGKQRQGCGKDSPKEGVNPQVWLSEACILQAQNAGRKCLVANSGELAEPAKQEIGVNKANSQGTDGNLTGDTQPIAKSDQAKAETVSGKYSFGIQKGHVND